MTDRLTRVATLHGKFARRLRNRTLHTLGLVPGVRLSATFRIRLFVV